MVKVAIVGAGPSGVLLAHYLLQRDERYCIDIYERRSDPRTIEFSKSRTFPLVINQRGMAALSNVAGLVEAVKAMSIESKGSVIYRTNGKSQTVPRQKPIFILNRTQLVMTLLETLSAKYDRTRLNIYFDCQCREIDFEAKTVTFENIAKADATANFTINYDLLIGADGAKSRVRQEFLATDLFELEQKYIPLAYKSLFIPANDTTTLRSGYIHTWRAGDGLSATLVPQADGSIDGTINFLRANNPVSKLTAIEEVQQFFQTNFPEIARLLTPAVAEAFLHRPISNILTIRCNRYHHGDSVLLVGDAAHATSPSLGQGCNSAFEDIAIFDRLLDEYADNIAEAIAQFTIRRKADAHALVELSDYAFPLAGKLRFIEFLIRLQTAQILHSIFPKFFSPSLLRLVSETTIPYAEVLQRYKGWIAKVKRTNQKFLLESGGMHRL